MKKTLVNLLCFVSFVFLFSAFSATKALAEKVRVELEVVMEYVKIEYPAPFVSVIDAKTNWLLGETDADGKVIFFLDQKKMTVKLHSMDCFPKKVKIKYKKKNVKDGVLHVKAVLKPLEKAPSKRQMKKDIEKIRMELEKKRQQESLKK